MNYSRQDSSATQPLHVNPNTGTDGRLRQDRSGISLNNAHQSVITQNLHNEQSMNFVSHRTSEGSPGPSQVISASNVDIKGGVRYETNNFFHRGDHSTVVNSLLSFSTLRFEEKQRHNFQIAKEATGTGQWLLDSQEFKDWKDGKLRILWCSGIPGAGKTVLASIVVNHLQIGYGFNKNVPCIYIYFDYKDQKRQDLTNLLSSLLAQLLRCRDQISPETKNIYDSLKAKQINPSSDDYLQMLIAQIDSFDRVFIVVDALDECVDDTETNTRNNFVDALHRLPPQVSIVFTSRPEVNIGKKIKADRQLVIVANDDDLRKYLESRINTFEHMQHLIDIGMQKDKKFLDNILRTIVKKSQGMFLLAKLHIESLASKHSFLEFQSGIKHLPLTSEEVYTISLDRIRGQPNEFKRNLAINALTWLVFAERALTITELNHALGFKDYKEDLSDDRFVNILTSACAGIVVVDSSANAICLAHYTVEEYLRQNESKIFKDTQSEMAETCLGYLSLNEFSKVPQSRSEAENRCKKYPFLSYAADHWGDHVSLGVRGPIYMLAWKFLFSGQKLKSTLQVMSNSRFRHEVDASGLHLAAYFGLSELVERAINLKKDLSINARTQRGETALHWAVFYHQRRFLKLLITHGADINVMDNERKTALHKALINRDVLSVEVLLSFRGRVDLKLEDSQGYTPLRFAARYGQLKIVDLLLKSGAEINAQDKDGWTALRWAAQHGHKEVVELLVQNNASLETPSTSGQDQEWTLLRWAAREGREPFIQLLIKKGVNLDETDSTGWTALRWAIEYGHGMTAWLLIQARVDINKADLKGFTPLHSAAENWEKSSEKSLIWLLLQNGAEIDARTKLGLTPLHIASSQGVCSPVWLLLEKGADIHAKTKLGLTALHMAVSKGHLLMASFCLERGADINAKTKLGLTALHMAVSQGHISIASLLSEKGADLSRVDNNGRTALHCAITEGHISTTELLMQRNENLVNATDEERRTGLHIAASAGDMKIVKLLVDNGTELDARDREGYTPLHRAVSQQHQEVVRFLVKRGANVNIPNKKKWTALHSAASIGSTALVGEILESDGVDTGVLNKEDLTPWELAKDRNYNMEKF